MQGLFYIADRSARRYNHISIQGGQTPRLSPESDGVDHRNNEWKPIVAKLNDLHKQWLMNPEYKRAHEALAPKFALARAVIEIRVTDSLLITALPLAQYYRHPKQEEHRRRGRLGRRVLRDIL